MFFFFQAEDGIRDLVRSRGLGDVYKRQLRRQGGHAEGPGARSRRSVRRQGEDRFGPAEGRELSLIHI